MSKDTTHLKKFLAWWCDLQLEDCALQLCRHNGTQNDYGMYLDLESTINEQMEDLEGFTEK